MNDRQSRRVRRRTIFIYCEGKTDALFVQHLKDLYLQHRTKQITIRKGAGGGDSKFILAVKKEASSAEYDKKYIVLDSNGKTPQEREELKISAKREEIQLIWQRPCLEGVFLRILKTENFIKKSSQHCKSTFKENYLNSNNQSLTPHVLKKILNKSILEKKRQQLLELNQLIQLMEE